ncbi:MAG: hypothetical protein HZA91_20225 [Verrucomicrobia bacterium]|nr:hypothetical protein [Verrucomicrobiota bacterium]
MKTTLEIPDDLFREAKAKAATEGRKLKDLVADALRAVVRQQPAAASDLRKTRFPILKSNKPGALSAEDVSRAEADMKPIEPSHPTAPTRASSRSPTTCSKRPAASPRRDSDDDCRR